MIVSPGQQGATQGFRWIEPEFRVAFVRVGRSYVPLLE